VTITKREKNAIRRAIITIDKIAAKTAVSTLYDVSEEQAHTYLDTAITIHDAYQSLEENLERLFSGRVTHVQALLDTIDTLADNYAEKVTDLWQNPVATTVIDNNVSKRTLRKFLEENHEQNHQLLEEEIRKTLHGFRTNPGRYVFSPEQPIGFLFTSLFTTEMKHILPDNPTEYAHALTDQIRRVLVGGNRAANQYAKDLLEAFSAKTSESEDPLVIQVMTKTVLFQQTMEEMEPFLGDYAALTSNHLKLLAVFPPDRAGYRLTNSVVSGVRKIGDGKRTSILAKLLSTVQPDDRFDVFEYVAEQPELLDIASMLHRSQAAGIQDLAEMLLDPDTIPGKQQESLIDSILRLSHKPANVQNMGLLVRRGLDVLLDEESQLILSVFEQNEHAYVFIDSYLDTKEEHPRQARGLLAIAQSALPLREGKRLASHLEKISEDQLEWIDESSPGEIVANLYRRKETGEIRKTRVIKQGWYERMQHSLVVVGKTQEERDIVDDAYTALPDTLRGRLRSAWRARQNVLIPFASDVARYAENQTYRTLLKNRTLFDAYISVLAKNKKHASKLRRLLDKNDDDVGNRVRALLQPHDAEETASLISAETLPPRDNLQNYDRIVIWGGYYSDEDRKAFERAFSLPVKLCDRRENKRKAPKADECSTISPGDFVVFISSKVGHKSYASAKARADATEGVSRFHVIGQNTDRVISEIGSYFGLPQ